MVQCFAIDDQKLVSSCSFIVRVVPPAEEVPALGTVFLGILTALSAGVGALILRRRSAY